MVSPPEGGDRDVVEVLGADRPLLRDRWRAVPRRVRWTATAATCAAVFTAVLGYLAAHRPPPPPPHPAATTTVRITDVGLPAGLDQDFPVTLRADAASRVTYMGMRDRYEGQFVFLSVVPVPGFELRPGRAHALHTRFIVFCHGRRPPRGTPLLYVLVRNDRGQESTPVVPTESQSDSLDRAVRKACAD